MAGKTADELFSEINGLTETELELLAAALQQKLGVSLENRGTEKSFGEVMQEPGYEIHLIECDPHNINAIKLIREFSYRSLAESKKCLSHLPMKIISYCSDSEAFTIKKRFEEVGAVVKLERVWS